MNVDPVLPRSRRPGSPIPYEASESSIQYEGSLPRPFYQDSLPFFSPIDAHIPRSPNHDSIDTIAFDQTQVADLGPSPLVFPNALHFLPLDASSTTTSAFDDRSTQLSGSSTATSFSPGQSPRLIDLLLPGSDLDAPPPPEFVDFQYEPGLQYRPQGHDAEQTYSTQECLEADNGVEEIPRQDPAIAWVMRWPSPSLSDSSSSSEGSSCNAMYRQPGILPGSPEMLMLRFDRQTCGILSVKDGPNENPWRTMVWPLAHDSPALYHAISSMSAFHTSKEKPALRVHGIEHMRQSIECLATGIQNMRTDTALATTLVLAFSESWDQHTSTGIEHLRGAKVLVNRALTNHQHNALDSEDLDRLKFLCNTWVYMDVIARLTSVDDDESNDFDTALTAYGPMFRCHEVDPLMGCASTLFPLIGRVANLVRKVMRVPSNTITIVSQANDLKTAIEKWEPPCFFEAPEDPSSEIQHSLLTAEAYRWATLLYLHQAVPEIPSIPADELAKKVLLKLAAVPISSRAVIVQIYPLLAAGCEVVSYEERLWVEERWAAMVQRMSIGNLDRCWEVIREVWNRRDGDEDERTRQRYCHTSPCQRMKRKFKEREYSDRVGCSEPSGSVKYRMSSFSTSMRPPRLMKRSTDVLEYIDHERTVRGRLHWVGVMKDWNWEGQSHRSCCSVRRLTTVSATGLSP